MDPTLQDNVLVLDDFAEHICHLGRSHNLHSIIKSGLIPGGKSVKKERHAVFFTAVNPMVVDQHKEVEYDLTNSTVAVYKNHWNIQTYSVLVQFYQTRSDAIILYNTLPAICIEKVVIRKSGHRKVYQSPRFPHRAVLLPNLHHGRQDSSKFEARTSVDHQRKESKEYGETHGDGNSYRGAEEFGETRSGNIDFRIQGVPHSVVQKQDDIRRETVKKLIHQFETPESRVADGRTQTRTKNSICSARRRRN